MSIPEIDSLKCLNGSLEVVDSVCYLGHITSVWDSCSKSMGELTGKSLRSYYYYWQQRSLLSEWMEDCMILVLELPVCGP